MKNKKTISIGLLVVGIIVLVLSLAADYIGIGDAVPNFGPQQIAGTIVGAIVAVVGLFLMLRK